MYDVIVVGGGPAGASAAIQLARRGRRVLLIEKDRMPRDKLCGEFLSPEVADMCSRVGVFHDVLNAGARPITHLLCTSACGARVNLELPGTGFGFSRRNFDNLLFERASEAGAHVRDGLAVKRISGDLQSSFKVDCARESFRARAIIGAYGRHTPLDRRLERPSASRRTSFVAFKGHFSGKLPEAHVELHAFPGGYCGILEEEEDRVNVCWISRSESLKAAGGSPQELLHWIGASNKSLRARIDRFEPVTPFLAAANLVFRRKELFASDICMIGDAAGMIAPLCGDGMAMALRSAELAAPLLDDFLASAVGPEGLKRRYALVWKKEFSRRMRLGRILQAGMSRPWATMFAGAVVGLLPQLARPLLKATRG